jgi:hypothetical protein
VEFLFETEARQYLAQLDDTKWYNTISKSLFESIQNTVVSLKYKVFVVIVCAGHSEGAGVVTTLTHLANQTLDTSLYEIILFINTKDGLEDITTPFVSNFIASNQCIPIHVFHHTWNIEEQTQLRFGILRKIATDIAIMRAFGQKIQNPFIVSLDADVHYCPNSYLTSYVRRFLSPTYPFAILGKVDWSGYEQNDLYRASIRMFQYIDVFDRHAGVSTSNLLSKFPRIIELNGCNNAFRASVYCHLSGYDPSRDIEYYQQAEDSEFGYRISSLSHPFEPVVYGYKGTGVIFDGRRAIATFNNGNAPHEMWKSWKNMGDNERVQSELQACKAGGNPIFFQNELERLYNKTLVSNFGVNYLYGEQADHYTLLVHKLAQLLGFEVSVDINCQHRPVKIINIDTILKRLS